MTPVAHGLEWGCPKTHQLPTVCVWKSPLIQPLLNCPGSGFSSGEGHDAPRCPSKALPLRRRLPGVNCSDGRCTSPLRRRWRQAGCHGPGGSVGQGVGEFRTGWRPSPPNAAHPRPSFSCTTDGAAPGARVSVCDLSHRYARTCHCQPGTHPHTCAESSEH